MNFDTVGSFVWKHLNSINTKMFYEPLTNVKTKNPKNDLCGGDSLSESNSAGPPYKLSCFWINALYVVVFTIKGEV